MPAYKNKDNGTWYVMTQYTNWKGERKPKCKRDLIPNERRRNGSILSDNKIREIWICPFPPLLKSTVKSKSHD